MMEYALLLTALDMGFGDVSISRKQNTKMLKDHLMGEKILKVEGSALFVMIAEVRKYD